MVSRRFARRTLPVALAVTAMLTLSAALSGAVASPDTDPPALAGPPQVTQVESSHRPSVETAPKAEPMAALDGGWVGPPMLPRIQDWDVAFGMIFDENTQTVGRQKLTFKLPKMTVMFYGGTCFIYNTGDTIRVTQYGRYGAYDGCKSYPKEVAEAIDKMISKVPAAAAPYWLGLGGDVWVQSPAGASQPFGLFPPITVRSVAFGSIPVQATVHLSQSVRDGLIVPFHFSQIVSMFDMAEGTEVPGFGPAPAGEGAVALMVPPIFTGSLDIRLSDVTVDGVPLAVGDNCAASASLKMSPKGGFRDGSDPIVKGEPGEFSAAYEGKSYLPGNVDIGAFSGCTSGSEGLDPLLTSMISGPDNHIDETLISGYTIWCMPNFYIGDGVPVGREACDLNYAPPTGDMSLAAGRAASRTSQSPPEMPKEMLDALPAPVRKQLKQLMAQLASRGNAVK